MGGEKKRFKDPIYGYIKINKDFVTNFIDTPCFQRLRYITQTSYSPVYPSALHNRFSHSLGVYHLGEIVYTHIELFLKTNKGFKYKKESIKWVENHKNIFLAACLLHDVGHAPFSHTGEKFYETYITDFNDIVNDMISRHGNCDFKDIARSNGESADLHECMSVYIAFKTFDYYFDGLEAETKEFFARCITGYKYKNDELELTQIKNCVIELLNGNL